MVLRIIFLYIEPRTIHNGFLQGSKRPSSVIAKDQIKTSVKLFNNNEGQFVQFILFPQHLQRYFTTIFESYIIAMSPKIENFTEK